MTNTASVHCAAFSLIFHPKALNFGEIWEVGQRSPHGLVCGS